MTRKHHSRRNLSLTAFGQAAAGRALILTSLLALSACATHRDSQSGAGRFEQADANHDGRMTLQEWSGGYSARAADFKKRDANHDGTVTKEEAIKYGRAHGVANEILREADKNHDGALDKAEMQAYYASREGPSN